MSVSEEQASHSEQHVQEQEQDQFYNSGSEVGEGEEDVYAILSHKNAGESTEVTKKKNVRKIRSEFPSNDADEPAFVGLHNDAAEQDDTSATSIYGQPTKRQLLEERMDSAMRVKTMRRRKADEDDLERMQDDKIDDLKDRMIKAANLDVDKNSQGQIATEKLKLLTEVSSVLSKADLAISILDNNLLEAVRLWLEPLPDASMPAYQIQKELISGLITLPIKTDHLIALGIGKVLVFYQRSKRTENNLKRIVDKLIGDWTRPILNKSDSYKDRTIQFNEYEKSRFSNQLQSQRLLSKKPKEEKTLYEQSAERRRRAAIPSARTTAYKIAPKVDPSLLRRQMMRSQGGASGLRDERFRRINLKLTSMGSKKKSVKKGGPSIEGRNLAM